MKHSIPYMRETKTGWSYNPPWIAACKPPKVTTMPKPRVEDDSKTIARLRKIKGDERTDRYVGRRTGDYHLVATDGYRALLLPGEGNGKEMPGFGDIPFNFVVLPEQFYIVLQRVIAFHSEKPWAVVITINITSLTVWAEAQDDTYEESIITPSIGEATIMLNAKYLLDALGVWPLYLHFSDKDCMVVLRPDDDSWRYLLVPLKL